MLLDHRLSPLSGDQPNSAVILLHGLGDSGAGLIDLGMAWRTGLPNTLFVAPDAPQPCDMAPMGYQWFSLQSRTPDAMLKGLMAAVPALDDYIDQLLRTTALTADRVALVGFSQGAMMSLYIGPRQRRSLAGIISYAGAMLGAEKLGDQLQSRPPVLLVHGMQDDVVPFAALAHAELCLDIAGIEVESLACPDLGHSIDSVGLAKGMKFLQKIFTDSSNA